MTRDNRQILVNPHSSQEKIPVGALNLGEIAVQHNNVEDAALYVETVADSQSASTIAKFIPEKAIDSKIENAIDVIQMEIDGINEAVGLPHEESGATPWGTASTVWDAIETVYSEMTAGTAAANTKLVKNSNEDTNNYMTLTAQTDAATSSITYTIGLKGIKDALDAVNDAIENVSGATDDLLDALDFTGVTQEGKPIVNVTQEDGQVSAEAGTIDAEFVTVGTGETPLDEVLEELEEKIDANAVTSDDGSVIVTTGANGTDLAVNVDGETIAKNANGELYADLKLTGVTPSSTNVKEEFALVDGQGNQLGTTVKVYKDSALQNVYLGHIDDVLSDDEDPTSIVAGSGDTALCFIYHKEDGTYELVAVNVEDFLSESEFADGLEVENHVVSVKVDDASEEVVIAEGMTAPVLSVGEDGVKVDNIQTAIDHAVDELGDQLQGDIEDLNVRVDELEDQLDAASVTEGASFENYVKLNITNDGQGATAVTIDDTDLKSAIDLINEDIEDEAVARQEADEALMGTSASTSAETSLMGIRKLIENITTTLVQSIDGDEVLIHVDKTDTPEGDQITVSATTKLQGAVALAETSVQEVGFAAVSTKDSTAYGSNAGAEIVDGTNGKKINLDLSLLRLDCGEY